MIKTIDTKMKALYVWMMTQGSRPHAVWVLSFVSFIESSFFPIPPDPLYIAMALKQRRRTWELAIICAVTSVLGGYLGYYIGYELYDTFGKWLVSAYGKQETFEAVRHQLQVNGFWIVALKGLTPIPYKIVTIGAGFAGMDLVEFTISSMIARGFRFAYLGAALWFWGEKIQKIMDKYFTTIVIAGLILLVIGFYVLKYVF